MKKRALIMLMATAVLSGNIPIMDVSAMMQRGNIVEEVATDKLETNQNKSTLDVAGAGTAEIVESGSCGENVTYTLDSEGVLTISGSGGISDYAFQYIGITERIKSVIIEEGVTAIYNGAFSLCSNLTSITIPDSVTTIGMAAFSDCSSLKSIVIPAGVSSCVNAFVGCSWVESVTIYSNAVSLDADFFKDFTNLKSIKVEGENENYLTENNVLYNKDKTELIFVLNEGENFEIPSGVTSIRGEAFSRCGSLKDIIIPASVESIESDAFVGCDNLKNIVVDSENECFSFEKNMLLSKDKTKLISVINPGESIEIPASVERIEDDAFVGCDNLKNIVVDSENEYFSSEKNMLFNKDKTEIIAVINPEESIEIPEGIRSIPSGMFAGCSNLKSITIPTSVSEIGREAFRGCSNLTSITIPNSVQVIDYRVLYACSSLTSVRIPESVTSIESQAFSACVNLVNVIIPSNVQSIATDAFRGCSNMTIYGEADSYAQTYAEDNEIPFKVLDELKSENTVTFHTNDGVAVAEPTRTIALGETIGELPITTKDSYVFVGWYTALDGGAAVTKDTMVLEDMNLYATWEEISEEEPDDEEKNDSDSNNNGNTNNSGNTNTNGNTDNSGNTNNNGNVDNSSNTNNNGEDKADANSDNKQMPISLKDAKITLSETICDYNGTAQTPAVTVQIGNKTLTADTDYVVSYENNINIGTATIIITGKGNYTEKVSATFEIQAEKNSVHTVGAYKYKILNNSEVAFMGLKNSKTKKVKIDKNVQIGGKSFKITTVASKALCRTNITSLEIGANVKKIETKAFENCKKLKTITIKSTKIKTFGKNAFKGIKASAKVKVPKKKLSNYKKQLKNAGLNKKVKVSK